MSRLQFDLRNRNNLETLRREAAAERRKRGRGERRKPPALDSHAFETLLFEIAQAVGSAPAVLDRESGEHFMQVRKLFDRGSRLSRAVYEETRQGKSVQFKSEKETNDGA